MEMQTESSFLNSAVVQPQEMNAPPMEREISCNEAPNDVETAAQAAAQDAVAATSAPAQDAVALAVKNGAPVQNAVASASAVNEAPANDASSEPAAKTRKIRNTDARQHCYLKSLEQGTTELLGDDLAVFAAFDAEGSPRLTRMQSWRRKSGLSETPSPKKSHKKIRRRKKTAEEAAENVVDNVAAAAADVETADANDDGNPQTETKEVDGNEQKEGDELMIDESAVMDMMEKGDLPTELQPVVEKRPDDDVDLPTKQQSDDVNEQEDPALTTSEAPVSTTAPAPISVPAAVPAPTPISPKGDTEDGEVSDDDDDA